MKIFLFNIYQFLKYRKKQYPINPNKIFRELNKSQYWSREKVEKYQLEKLNALILEVRKRSKFYASRFKNLDVPLIDLNQFKNVIPFMTKRDIIENSKEIKIEGSSKSYKHSTSGSSGDPISVFISGMAEAYRKAGALRFRDWWGIKPYEKSVLIWRYENQTGGNLIDKLKKAFKFRYDVNVYSLNDDTIKVHFEKIEKFKPTYIRGYTSGVLEFTRLLDQNNLKFKKASFKVAIVTAENLFDHDRKYIEQILKCKVANEFGSAEAGLFAYECPSGSMHIYEEANYIYNDNNLSAYMTEFFNDSMPLINYKNDDKLKISNHLCSCGITLRVIEELVGRESGYIEKSDGTKLNQGILICVFIELQEIGYSQAIEKFKVIQRGNNFDVYIVPLKNYNKEVENYIDNKMRTLIGEKIIIKFHIKDKIEREKSGKLRYFVKEK